MIKILFFIEKLYGGGAEKALCNLVNAMDQSIFDITVQTIWKYDPTDHLKPGIRYKYCYEQKNNYSSNAGGYAPQNTYTPSVTATDIDDSIF